MATHKKPNPNAGLSEQIVYEILLRLPVKTLLRFKAVCKSWFCLISSSYFVKTHLSISTNDPHLTRLHLLTYYYNQDQKQVFESHSVYSLLNEPVITDAIMIDNPNKNDNVGFVSVAGCCNGLVCLTNRRIGIVFLWNPSTRKIRRLPKLTNTERNVLRLFGFCYDESSDGFKLFVITGNIPCERKLSVYSSKSDSWKRIGDFPFGLAPSLEDGIFADGAVHWVAKKQNMQSSLTIVSVDIKKETFRELVLPPNYAEWGYTWTTLDTFGKSLSLLNSVTCEIWVFKECDVKEPWTKVFTLPRDGDGFRRFNPLRICVNGDILLVLDKTVRLYNSKDNTLKAKGLFHKNDKALYEFTYVESLVSP